MDDIFTLIARLAKTGGTLRIGPDPAAAGVEIRVEIPSQSGRGGTDGIVRYIDSRTVNDVIVRNELGRSLLQLAEDRHLVPG